MNRIKWGLLGSSGKMGAQVIRSFSDTPEFKSKLELVFEDSGRNEGLAAEKLYDAKPQVLLDFSRPEALLPLSLALKKIKTKVVICSTGWKEEEKNVLIKNIGQKNILWVPNSSFGISAFSKALEALCEKLKSSTELKIEIFEAHHIHKKDAPSGTALWLKDLIKSHLGSNVPEIVIQSHREGEIVGLHKVKMSLPGESIELTHEALDRNIFAVGALRTLSQLEFQ
jgi:4-hydroxy-tetrahydrodipicolinate reductase